MLFLAMLQTSRRHGSGGFIGEGSYREEIRWDTRLSSEDIPPSTPFSPLTFPLP